jgi:NADPH2:quinone reductase
MRGWQTVRAGRPSEALEQKSDIRPPAPRDDTVLVEVLAAGIGLPDALMCQGSYVLTPPLPFTQGQEVVGRVIGWGDAVEGRKVGDRVMAVTSFFSGDGSFAEQCLALDDFCLPVPEGMSDAEAAAFLIPMHTAYIGLITRGRLEAGETLLVLGGAGGTGTAAVQIGKALGARVIASVAGADKVAYCKSLGADHVIDRLEQEIAPAVLELTGGQGADCVYDPVGGAAYTAATRCVAHEGRILLIGFASGSWGPVDPAHVVTRNYSVVGVIPSSYDRAFKEAAQERLVAWWREGRLRVHVDEMVDFAALPEALERLANNEVRGKLVLKVHADATSP